MALIDNTPLDTPIWVTPMGSVFIKAQPVWAKWFNQIVAVVNGLMGSTGYTIVHVTTLRVYDVNTATTTQLANTLGTLIADLKSKGLLS